MDAALVSLVSQQQVGSIRPSNIRYAEAVEEFNVFYLEKHGRATAAAVKATEEKRQGGIRRDKMSEKSRHWRLIMVRQLTAEGDKRVSKRFFKLFR